MSLFSDAFAPVWDQSVAIFGDKCTINAVEYDCVIHALEETDGVETGRAGRSQNVAGRVIMSTMSWIAAGGRKGIHIILPGGTYRVMNNPFLGYESNTVELSVIPLV